MHVSRYEEYTMQSTIRTSLRILWRRANSRCYHKARYRTVRELFRDTDVVYRTQIRGSGALTACGSNDPWPGVASEFVIYGGDSALIGDHAILNEFHGTDP
jgi:hypothetical protein